MITIAIHFTVTGRGYIDDGDSDQSGGGGEYDSDCGYLGGGGFDTGGGGYSGGGGGYDLGGGGCDSGGERCDSGGGGD